MADGIVRKQKNTVLTIMISTVFFIMKTYLRQGVAELPAADFRAG